MIRLENDGVRWEIRPEFADVLETVLESKGETVKASPAKSVTRHRVGVADYYIKRYQHSAVLLRSFKFLFKATQARQEWRLAHALEARGIPTVRHLALGERSNWSGVHESILVTAGFDGVPLEDATTTDPRRVLEFVRRMHDAGVLQRDLHPGNLLVRVDPFEIRLVDLHGAELKDAIPEPERERNLARLCVAFPLPVNPRVLELAEQLRRELWHTRSRRCLRHNRDFAPLRFGGLRWWTRTAALSDSVRTILADPDGFLATRAEILKPGRSSTVGRAEAVVLKRYNLRKVANLLKDLFRPSKARRSYRKAYHLELAGIPTANIIATADRRLGGLLLRSFVLMEEVPGARELGTILGEAAAIDPALIRQTAELIGKLHRSGLSHRDLKESNLVLSRDGILHLLDLDGLEFLDLVPDSRAAADLERFARGVGQYGVVQRTHRIRFLRDYCRVRAIRKIPRRT